MGTVAKNIDYKFKEITCYSMIVTSNSNYQSINFYINFIMVTLRCMQCYLHIYT